MDVHLRAAVHLKVRIFRTYPMEETKVLNEQRIGIVFVKKCHFFHGTFYFFFKQKRVHRHIDTHTADMTVLHCFNKFIMIKVSRKGTGTVVADSKIDCIAAALYCRDQRFRITRRRKQFNFTVQVLF